VTDKPKAALDVDADTLQATVEARLPDNNTREISPFDVRQSFVDVISHGRNVVDSYGDKEDRLTSQIYGGGPGITPFYSVVLAGGGTPLLAFPNVGIVSPKFTAAANQITCLLAGQISAHFMMGCCYSANSVFQVHLHINGAPSGVISGAADMGTDCAQTGFFVPLLVSANDVLTLEGYHLSGGSSTLDVTSSMFWVSYGS
jgi:hypothetical protein